MFDIEPVSLGISVFLLLGFLSPLIVYKIKQSKKANYLKDIFNQSEREFGLKCDQKDFWRDYYAIGLDTDKKMMLYIKFDTKPEILNMDLKNCSQISLIQKTEVFKQENKNREIIHYRGLKLNFPTNNHHEINLEFYNGDLFSDLQGEGPLVLKWKELIAQNLNQIK